MKKELFSLLAAAAILGAGCASDQPTTENPSVNPGASDSVATSTNAKPAITAAVDNVLVNDVSTDGGFVSETKEVLSKDAKEIFVTAQIGNGDTSMSMTATLVHVGDKEKIDPKSVDFTDSGDVQEAFSFERTGKSWPIGDYQATITLSNGATKTTNFKVE